MPIPAHYFMALDLCSFYDAFLDAGVGGVCFAVLVNRKQRPYRAA